MAGKGACKGKYCFDRKTGGIVSGRKPVCTLCQCAQKAKEKRHKNNGNTCVENNAML